MSDRIYPITITATETHGIDRWAIPHRMGIPFPKGVLSDANQLRLQKLTQQAIPFQHKALSHWPDNSIRWLLVDFRLSAQKNTDTTYQLLPGKATAAVQAITMKQQHNHVHIDNATISFDMHRQHFLQLSNIHLSGQPHPMQTTDFFLIDDHGQKHRAHIDNMEIPAQADSMRSEIRSNGYFGNKNNHRFFRFESTLVLFADSPIIELDITLHNPRASRHKGGFWDLGDPGSLYFKSLILECRFDQIQQVALNNLETDKEQHITDNFRLYQDSSGGENWNHHIHIDKDGNSTVSFKGYQITINNQVIESGNRASPLVTVRNQNGSPTTEAHIRQFWQNFPKAFSSDGDTLKIELFPETPKSPYELQGGEKKTHTVRVSLNSQTHSLKPFVTPINVRLPLRHYYSSDALPGLPPETTRTPLDEIIEEGIKGENNFFIKREIADEYGWRHFGELWADHETLEHDNDKTLVSHYNNQYDPIYGFFRQYIITGDYRWYELMDDLFRHVIDIDIYHTDQDRPEYNHGLFWHTDHYLDGRFCTHRTFSSQHMNVDHVEQSGGGPGTEHCYSTSLLYLHFLTGDLVAKKTVVQLAGWIETLTERSSSVLLRFKYFLTKELKQILELFLGRKLLYNRYPLSRGTGNYLNTILDAYLLTNDEKYIEIADNIVTNTFSTNDDINLKGLEEIEETWSYVIFLQAITRYIKIKHDSRKIDLAYKYAYAALVHYLDWIIENEKPYLENASKLVYPNSTWIAQDLRKAYLLSFAYPIFKSHQIKKLENKILLNLKSNFIDKSDYISTRVLAICMQNHYHDLNQSNVIYPVFSTKNIDGVEKLNLPILSSQIVGIKIFLTFLKDLLHIIGHFSLKKEIRWVKHTLKS